MQSKHFRNPWDHPKSRPPFPGDLAGSLPACLLQSLASPAHLPTKLDGICKSYSQRNVKHYVEKVLICLCKRKACCLNIYWINAHLGICSGLPSSKKNAMQGLNPGTSIPQAFAASYSSSSKKGCIVSKRSSTGFCIFTQFGQPCSSV